MGLKAIKQSLSQAGNHRYGEVNIIDDLRNHISDLEEVLFDMLAYLQDQEED